jgi:streptomycin 6-kinase
VLRYFAGVGAVHLLAADEDACLVEFVSGPKLSMETEGRGLAILCEVMRQLHKLRPTPAPELPTLADFCASLFRRPEFAESINEARALLADEVPAGPLHADLHHDNILHCPERGWLAIDPKGAYGDFTFEAATALFNPLGRVRDPLGAAERISRTMGFDRERLLRWGYVLGHLRAAWSIEDGLDPSEDLWIAKILRI